MFTVILGALWAMLVVTSDALTPANQITGVATMLGLVAWAGAQYRRAGPPIVRDVLVLVSLAGMVVAFPEAGWVYGPAFLVLFQRTLDTRGVWTWVWTGIAFSAFEAVRLGEADASPVFSLPSLITLAGYAIGAYIMRTLAEASRAHERSARREAQLGRGAHELLTATTTEQVAEIALATSLRVVAEPDASGSVWTRADDRREFRLLATAGPLSPSQQIVDLDRFPPRMVEVLGSGEPVVAGPTTVDAIRHHITLDQGINELMLLPIVRRQVAAVVAVGLSGRADEDLVDVLARFSAELSLAWERVELLTRLQEANHELRRADDLKNQFVSMVSHELRTPLTAICGFAETLATQWHRIEDDRRLGFVEVIARQAGRQRVIVEDLLTMSRILSGHVTAEVEPVKVNEAVRGAVEVVGLAVTVAVPDDLAVEVDPHHLEQVLTNLLVNADKYGAAPYVISAAPAGDRVELCVVDHGEGVDPDFRGRLFEPFSQDDVGDRRTSRGVGLGLAICRDLLLANGGTIAHRETPGGGATFVVDLAAA